MQSRWEGPARAGPGRPIHPPGHGFWPNAALPAVPSNAMGGAHSANAGGCMHRISRIWWLLLFPLGAQAAGIGAAEPASAWLYSGWACDPSVPGYQAEVHARRDDGQLLGRMIAAQPSKNPVSAACRSPHGVHGFRLFITRKPEWVDGKLHGVTLYTVDHHRHPAPFAHFSVRFVDSESSDR